MFSMKINCLIKEFFNRAIKKWRKPEQQPILQMIWFDGHTPSYDRKMLYEPFLTADVRIWLYVTALSFEIWRLRLQ